MNAVRSILLAAAAALAFASAAASPRVVADDACPYYAVDIADFATCDADDHIAFADDDVDTWAEWGPAWFAADEIAGEPARAEGRWPVDGPG